MYTFYIRHILKLFFGIVYGFKLSPAIRTPAAPMLQERWVCGVYALTEVLAVVDDGVEAGEVAEVGERVRAARQQGAGGPDAAHGGRALLLPRRRLRARVHLPGAPDVDVKLRGICLVSPGIGLPHV